MTPNPHPCEFIINIIKRVMKIQEGILNEYANPGKESLLYECDNQAIVFIVVKATGGYIRMNTKRRMN